MYAVTLDDLLTLDMLIGCSANRTGATTSRRQRMAVARMRREFLAAARLTARRSGVPVRGPAVVCYRFRLARVDWDAVVKPLQDALEVFLFEGADDRVIRGVHVLLERPVKTAGLLPRVDAVALPVAEEETALAVYRSWRSASAG